MPSYKLVVLVRHGPYEGDESKGQEVTLHNPLELHRNFLTLYTNILSKRFGPQTHSPLPLYHSPKLRTRLTAQVLSAAFAGWARTLIERPELDVGKNNIAAVVNDICDVGIIVAHAPDIGPYLSSLKNQNLYDGEAFLDCGEYALLELPPPSPKS